jgi:hypothetical protein
MFILLFSCSTNTNNLNSFLHIQSTNNKQAKINIDLFFDSKDNRYMYGDELKILVKSDKNCYFKIFHIETNTNTNNRIKMIYPTINDNNNYLKMNINHNVFQSQNKYFFSPPYGQGIIMVVASSKQFNNIKRDINLSWITVDGEKLDEMIKGDGQRGYIINILKPDEEYEYSKPVNMKEVYEIIQNDTKEQGGYFDGTETRGVYIINNIRASYNVQPDTNTIYFATYYLEKKSNDNSKPLLKASYYNFTFSVPENISQAIQTVRSSIENKGGTFNGNEKQGSFQAKGIAGQYQVTNLVNVIILDKPLVIPYSLIEKEVKNYFNVK